MGQIDGWPGSFLGLEVQVLNLFRRPTVKMGGFYKSQQENFWPKISPKCLFKKFRNFDNSKFGCSQKFGLNMDETDAIFEFFAQISINCGQ